MLVEILDVMSKSFAFIPIYCVMALIIARMDLTSRREPIVKVNWFDIF
jgi:hypothetical protein